MSIDCSLLDSRADFADYVQLMYQVSSDNLTSLEQCRPQMCSALWGVGNPDISGIGMIVGYVANIVLGLLFVAAVMATKPRPTATMPTTEDQCATPAAAKELPKTQWPKSNFHNNLVNSYKSYADASVFFAVSLQIATVVVLVRKDFGIDANGLGSITVQITRLVSVLVMLPLTLLTCVPDIRLDRPHLRFFLVCICWILFLYPFISRMISDFGPSQIGSGTQSVMPTPDWDIISGICLSGVAQPSAPELATIKAFGIGGSFFVSLLILGKLFFCLSNQRQTGNKGKLFEMIHNRYWSSTVVLLVFIFAVPQIWGVIRLRIYGGSLAYSSSNGFSDNAWTFGQVVAVLAFVPVLVELLYGTFCASG